MITSPMISAGTVTTFTALPISVSTIRSGANGSEKTTGTVITNASVHQKLRSW